MILWVTSASKKTKEGWPNFIAMYSAIGDGSARAYATTGWTKGYIKSTEENVAESSNRSVTGSFAAWMRFQTMAGTRSALSSGGASGKKKAD